MRMLAVRGAEGLARMRVAWGLAGTSDIGCLDSPASAPVQYVTPNFSNLHFHANSEHLRGGEHAFPCRFPDCAHCDPHDAAPDVLRVVSQGFSTEQRPTSC